MKILVACEESQRTTIQLRQLGHEAYSCDILPCSGGHDEWHIHQDVLPIINGYCTFTTADGVQHTIDMRWDMIIAHPPCTYLTVAGNRWFNEERYGNEATERKERQLEAARFFMALANADCERIAIENPVGVMSSQYRKPDQIVHPYMFGDPERKATCFWLKGLPKLQPTNIVEPNVIKFKNGKGSDGLWHMSTISLPKQERSICRSKTFPGMAKAMADQWAGKANE